MEITKEIASTTDKAVEEFNKGDLETALKTWHRAMQLVIEKLPAKETFSSMFLTTKGVVLVTDDSSKFYEKLCNLQEVFIHSQEARSRSLEGALEEENVLITTGTDNQPDLRNATVYKIWQPFDRDEKGEFLRWRKAEMSVNKRSDIETAVEKEEYGYSLE